MFRAFDALNGSQTVDNLVGIAIGLATFGGLLLAGLRRIVRREVSDIRETTKQLEHNGGSHVADYARDARDNSAQTKADIAELKRLSREQKDLLADHMLEADVSTRALRQLARDVEPLLADYYARRSPWQTTRHRARRERN